MLYLFDDQNSYPYEYDSKVIRVGTSDIALIILGMHMHS
jgi:hypothetical protein